MGRRVEWESKLTFLGERNLVLGLGEDSLDHDG